MMTYKQFMAAMQFPLGRTKLTISPAISGWSFRQVNHDVDQYPIVMAERGLAGTQPILHGTSSEGSTGLSNRTFVYPCIVGIRDGDAADDIETAIGLRFEHTLAAEHRHKFLEFGECGLVYCGAATPPAYPHTARCDVRWDLATGTTEPNVAEYRIRPFVGFDSDLYVYLRRQLPPNHDEPESGGEVDETALSDRTAAFAATDKLYMKIPWLHEYGEITVEIPLVNLHTAVAKVKSLLTPAPAED